MGELDGRVALITGAARGMGRAHAVRLAEDGADIIALDVLQHAPTLEYQQASERDMAATVAAVSATGQQILAREVDVRDEAALNASVAEAMAEFRRLDVVVANAGILRQGVSWELSTSHWQDVIDVNLTGAWQTVKACIPSMLSAGRGGSIVLTSSLAGLRGFRNMAGYVASKHGVVGLMRALANELGSHGIRVNAVCPGLVNTEMLMNERTFAQFRPDLERPTQDDATERFHTMQALPTAWLEPRDVSNAVAFLVSDQARFITGVALPVDAGQLVKT